MKILYAAGNRIGSNQQLFRFLTACSSQHQIKIAAYIKSSESLNHIDWTLDSLYNKFEKKQPKELNKLFGHMGIPKINIKPAEILLQEVDDFSPDLVISDAEPITAHIAKSLSLKLWYCSPLHLLDGVHWKSGDLRYTSLLKNTKKFLRSLPQADKYLIYSPFGDLINPPPLKKGYEWIQPYAYFVDNSLAEDIGCNMAVVQDKTRISQLSHILNCLEFDLTLFTHFPGEFSKLKTISILDIDKYKKALEKCGWFLSTGETSYIADAIYSCVNKICVCPNLTDPESLLNAIFCKLYGLGDDLAQVEYLDKFSIDEIEKSQNNKSYYKYMDKISAKKLHEKINGVT